MPSTVNQTREALPVFSVTVTVSTQWGDAQQVRLDTLLHFADRLSPAEGLKVLDAITGICNATNVKGIATLTQSGQRALEALERDTGARDMGHGKESTPGEADGHAE